MNKALLVVALLFTNALSVAAQTTELLKNPGFEAGDVHWNMGANTELAFISKEAAHRGSNGLRVVDKSLELGSGVLSERFPVKPGQKVKIEFWCRTKDAKFISVHMVPFSKDKRWTTDASEKLPGVVVTDPSGKWKKYELEVVTTDQMDAVAIWVHSWSSSVGTADFDDFELKIK